MGWNSAAKHGQKAVDRADDAVVTKETWSDIVTALRPDSNGRYKPIGYWMPRGVAGHELAHCADYLRWAESETDALGSSLGNTKVTYTPGIWNRAENGMALSKAVLTAATGWKDAMIRQFDFTGEGPVCARTAGPYHELVDAIELRAKKNRWPRLKSTIYEAPTTPAG